MLYITSLYIRGYQDNMSPSTAYPINIDISYQILDSTNYLLNVTVFQNVIVTRLHFSQIIYNIDDVQSSNAYFIVY